MWPEKAAMADFAVRTLKVRPENLNSWYRHAWWGYHATKLLDYCTRNNLSDKIETLFEGEHQWAELDKALSLGKGVILLTAHLGTGYIPGYVATEAGYQVKSIARGKDFARNPANEEKFIFVLTQEERRQSLIKAIRHLRSGGLIAVAPTGQIGRSSIVVNFLGEPLKTSLGVAELARLSGAPVVWASATWKSLDRLRLIIEPLDLPERNHSDWEAQLFSAYFAKLAYQVLRCPQDLGFRLGFWTTLKWYNSERSIG